MVKFIVDRLILMLFVMLGASVLVFMLIHLVPGDPVRASLGIMVTEELIAEMTEKLGLNQPLHVQYFSWLGGVLRGDFGVSMQTLNPVSDRLAVAFPISLELVLLTTLTALVVGVPLGILVTIFRKLDFAFITLSIVGLSMPQFWVAILLIIFFSVDLKWLPVGSFVFLHQGLGPHLIYMIMPVLALALPMISVTMRITRTSLVEVSGMDYIRTMEAIGLSRLRITLTHAFKNALIPIVTITGLQFGYLLGGAVIIESIFGVPGLGRMILESASLKDYPTIQAVTMILTLWFVVVNFATDVLYAYLDPRIKYD